MHCANASVTSSAPRQGGAPPSSSSYAYGPLPMHASHRRYRSSSPAARHGFVLLAALCLGACAATGSSGKANQDAEPAVRIQTDEAAPLGKLLADLDSAIGRWNSLTLTATTNAEQREARILESVISDMAKRRSAELIEALETGPPINRIRAAGALGFSKSVEAQSPLLAALHDAHPDVVHNALTSLAILGRGDTPLDDICRVLDDNDDPQTRSQAAYALRSIVSAGGGSERAIGAARRGLSDDEPFVRSQCALVLGLESDTPSIPALCDALYDSVPLVGDAAAEALVGIAREEGAEKGRIARALVDAYSKSEARLRRRAKQALVRLSDVNYGEDVKLWSEWAQRLP